MLGTRTRSLTVYLSGLLLALSLVVAACGGDDDDPSPAQTPGEPTLTQTGATAPASSGDGDDHSGSGASVDTGPSTPQVGIPTAANGAVVVATVGGRQILTTEDGFTLYTFANDPADAGTSSCFASCAQAWPPFVITGVPTGGADLAAGLGTITRDDGRIQVSYKGRPLYRFANDEQAGDTNGDGVGGVWSVAVP